jgi:hypothetical protein
MKAWRQRELEVVLSVEVSIVSLGTNPDMCVKIFGSTVFFLRLPYFRGSESSCQGDW